ncbi:MAG: PD-(D/E)XK nuclease family protein [Ignisphaera sp.]
MSGSTVNELAEVFAELESRLLSKDVIAAKASTVKEFYWCAKKSYMILVSENLCDELRILGFDTKEIDAMLTGNTKLVEIGAMLHGARYGFCVEPMDTVFKDTETLYFFASMGFVIPRNIEVDGRVFQIQGAVDELVCSEDLSKCVVREYKYTGARRPWESMLKTARLQLKIYGWILSQGLPIRRLELVYRDMKTGETIYKEDFEFSPNEAEEEITNILRSYLRRELPEPETWKCSKCNLKQLCNRIF